MYTHVLLFNWTFPCGLHLEVKLEFGFLNPNGNCSARGESWRRPCIVRRFVSKKCPVVPFFVVVMVVVVIVVVMVVVVVESSSIVVDRRTVNCDL